MRAARVALGGNQRAEDRDVLEEGYAAVIIRGIVADQTGHPDRLAVLHSHPRAEYLIVEGRRALDRVRRRGRDIADFLGDVEGNQPAGVDARRHLHDDAGRMIVDAVDDRRVGGERARRGPGQHRHLLADLKTCRLVVEDHDLRRREHLDLGHRGERREREIRRFAQCEKGDSRGKAQGAELGKARQRAQGVGDVVGLEEELRAVLQRIIEVDLGDRRLDQYLERDDVDLAQHPLDHRVFARRRVDQQRIVAPVGDDAHAVLGRRTALPGLG